MYGKNQQGVLRSRSPSWYFLPRVSQTSHGFTDHICCYDLSPVLCTDWNILHIGANPKCLYKDSTSLRHKARRVTTTEACSKPHEGKSTKWEKHRNACLRLNMSGCSIANNLKKQHQHNRSCMASNCEPGDQCLARQWCLKNISCWLCHNNWFRFSIFQKIRDWNKLQ